MAEMIADVTDLRIPEASVSGAGAGADAGAGRPGMAPADPVLATGAAPGLRTGGGPPPAADPHAPSARAPVPSADVLVPSADPDAAPVGELPLGATPRSEIAAGIRLSFAAGLGMFPLGVAFGVLVMQTGLPWWLAPGLSIALFAGSVELLLVGMMAAAMPLATIALTVLLVNFRHVFYAFSFPLSVVRHPLARFYSVFALIDEAYAVTAARQGTWNRYRLVAMQVAFHSYWVGGGVAGVAIASVLPGQILGLEFALCALFITLTLDACRSKREIPSLLLAGLSYTLAAVLVPGSALFVGLLGFVALLVGRYLLLRRRRKGGE